MAEGTLSKKVKTASKSAVDGVRKTFGTGMDGLTLRQFQEESLERFAEIVEVLVAQHAEIEGLRKRLEVLERA